MIPDRGRNYLKSGRVKYLSLKSGRGTAFVRGGSWYRVSFAFSGDEVCDIFCDCPFPGMCKHEAAMLLALEDLNKELSFPDGPDFTAMEREFFWDMAEATHQEIAL